MVQQVDARSVERRMQEGVPVINVLSRPAYEAMHIPGSYNAPVDAPGFEEAVERFAPDKAKPVVVHCSNLACQDSSKAARKLEAMGYRDVYHYAAGIEDWQRSGRPVEGSSERRPLERPERGRRREPAVREENAPPSG